MAEAGQKLESEAYVHNPSDFIDIHSKDKNVPLGRCQEESGYSPVGDDNNCDRMQRGMGDNLANIPSKLVENSYNDVSFCDTAIKSPIQVSEHGDIPKERVPFENDSDEEYLSAEDGDDSEEDFIPTASEEDDLKANALHHEKVKEEEFEATGRSESEWEESYDKATADDETVVIDELEIRKQQEELLSDEEKSERKDKAQELKDVGNSKFREGDFDGASEAYSEALDICPLHFHKERSIMFSNRAACKMKKELLEGAITDSTSALELHPHYLKALLRRAELYEKTEKLDEALKDYQKAVELDPSQNMARAACVKLAEQIKDRNEKMKEEMMGKLKDLGNMVLRPFGLSVNNFNLQQDPETGSYSVQFAQNPPKNGS